MGRASWALMYRLRFEGGNPHPDTAKIIMVPLSQVPWRKQHGWRFIGEDSDLYPVKEPDGED